MWATYSAAVLDWNNAITKTEPAPGETVVDQASWRRTALPPDIGQVVPVFQGGGALGAYQIGVYQALHDAGIEPDWVIGTSIGAINASLIAGNAVADRLSRLREFWSRVQQGPFHQAIAPLPVFGGLAANWSGAFQGFSSPIHLPSLVPTYRWAPVRLRSTPRNLSTGH
jgi:NTE family protein